MAPLQLQRMAMAGFIFVIGISFAFASRKNSEPEKLQSNTPPFPRKWSSLPKEAELDPSPVQTSPLLDFLETQIAMHGDKVKHPYSFLVSQNRKNLIEGVSHFGAHPENDVLQTVTVDDELFEGPASAPVTIIEYADLQCGACAQMHAFLKSQLLPRFGARIRMVYKEFPLAQIHDWALQGSMANQCTRKDGSEVALRFRDLIYTHQSEITKENARDKLLQYGELAGADRVTLAQCLDSKATLSHVKRSMAEGRRLAVRSTPTLFIDGKRFTTNSTGAVLYRMIVDALKDSGK